jgi:hypothetical protein
MYLHSSPAGLPSPYSIVGWFSCLQILLEYVGLVDCFYFVGVIVFGEIIILLRELRVDEVVDDFVPLGCLLDLVAGFMELLDVLREVVLEVVLEVGSLNFHQLFGGRNLILWLGVNGLKIESETRSCILPD